MASEVDWIRKNMDLTEKNVHFNYEYFSNIQCT